MRHLLVVATMMIGLGVVATAASADHSKRWGDNFLEQLTKNGSPGG